MPHINFMELTVVIKKNWFTRPPQPHAGDVTALVTILFYVLALTFLNNLHGAEAWMPASRVAVFQKHEWWRLWTTLLAHGDMSHLLNNSLMFIPLTYLLTAYFGVWFFPVLGILMGGLINYIVLQTLPVNATLIGMSGVVYWMGAAWFTLFMIIDRRKNLKFRFANVLFLMLMLFLPETYYPHVSYLSHFVGFVLGVLSALGLYWLHRHRFEAAEEKEYIFDEGEEEFEKFSSAIDQ